MEAWGKKTTVLVVEDDVHLLEGIRDILDLEGYDVLMAQNGVQALDMLKSQADAPDLIVSDIMMPQMDGVEFFQNVRQEADWLSIPFIFLTAKGEKSDYYKGLRLGVDDYIVKPYDPADLIVKIESRLKRQQILNRAHSDSLSKLKRQILTILNHEFRTPLTFVVAYADMLNAPETNKLPENEILTYLKGVGAGADRLRSLIENFILLVELETGDAKQVYSWRRGPISNLRGVFEMACGRVKALQEGTHPFTITVEGDIPTFTADMEYLTVAVMHLLTNATKFSEMGKPVTLGARVDGGQLVIWVTDKGRGIPPEERDKIWESFYQIDRATYEDQGAGAGLSIVRGVAKMHGVTVTLTSEVNVGSTFTITLPL